MKKMALCLLTVWVMAGLYGAPVTQAVVGQVAEHWFRQLPQFSHIPASIQSVKHFSLKETDTTGLFLVSLNPSGYLLLSDNDICQPIIAYSPDGSFPLPIQSEAVKSFLETFADAISAATKANKTSTHPDWIRLLNGIPEQPTPNRDVVSMLNTTWHQVYPYNAMCPASTGGPGGHTSAGGLAVAMAQIARFWSHPIHGTGSYSYNLQPWGTLSADFANSTYLYTSMPNSLDATPNDQISQLIYHWGIAIHTNYANYVSTAVPADVLNALTAYFDYSSNAVLRSLASSSINQWETWLRTDLEGGKPVFMFDNDTSNAQIHAWVVDGYIQNNFFHMNWGWGGMYNGYYYMNDLTPGLSAFANNVGGIFNIIPNYNYAVPENLTASVTENNNVILQWNALVASGLQGFQIYRNSNLLTTLDDPLATSYTDTGLAVGTYTYYLRAIYPFGTSEPSNNTSVNIFPPAVSDVTDGFETYTSFAAVPTPWSCYDYDNASTQQIAGYNFFHEGYAASFIIFQPYACIPPMTEIVPHGGGKLAACFGAVSVPNDDWMIYSPWNSGTASQIRFWAKSEVTATTSLSKFEVGITSDLANPTQLTIISGSTPITVPNAWTEYRFNLAQHNQPLIVGLHCVSQNGYFLLIDDLRLSTTVPNEDAISAMLPGIAVFPNPFHKQTAISFELKQPSRVQVSVYDIKGRLVSRLLNEAKQAGLHELEWDGSDMHHQPVAPAVYLIKLQANGLTTTKRVTVF